jgi:Tfp pilus assembly protein PilE
LTLSKNPPYTQQGLSLIQVMAALGVIGLILTVATNAYLDHQTSYRVTQAMATAEKFKALVNENYRTKSDNKTISLPQGTTTEQGEGGEWSVSIDPNSAVIIVKVLIDTKFQTLMWAPVTKDHPDDKAMRAPSWVCVIKPSAMPTHDNLQGVFTTSESADFDIKWAPKKCL